MALRTGGFLTCYSIATYTNYGGRTYYGDPAVIDRYRPLWWSDENHFERPPRCPRQDDDRHPFESTRPKSPIIKAFHGRVHPINWTWYSEMLVTPEVLADFEAAGFTGFEPHRVRYSLPKRESKREPKTPELYNIVVTGSAGDLHWRSLYRRRWVCPICGSTEYSPAQNGLWVARDRWDGCDFFSFNQYREFILVTQRVADLIVAKRWKVCSLILSTDLRLYP